MLYEDEQETIISYGPYTDEAIVWTNYPHDIKKLKKLMIENPEYVKIIKEHKDSTVISIPKKYVKIKSTIKKYK